MKHISQALNEAFMKFPKHKPARSEAYRRYVAQFPCDHCGVEGYSQAAHPNTGKGMGMKADDFSCFPLCAPRFGVPGCHALFDQSALMTKDERRQYENDAIARMRARAREDGWFGEEAAA